LSQFILTANQILHRFVVSIRESIKDTPMTAIDRLGTRVAALYETAFAYFEQLSEETNGATAIEYGLIAALIAVAAVTVMGTVGTNLSSTFGSIASYL
jgi:pilus assembly protein Flp/PilA